MGMKRSFRAHCVPKLELGNEQQYTPRALVPKLQLGNPYALKLLLLVSRAKQDSPDGSPDVLGVK